MRGENNKTGIGEFGRIQQTKRLVFWQPADILVLVFTAHFQGSSPALSLGWPAVKKKAKKVENVDG